MVRPVSRRACSKTSYSQRSVVEATSNVLGQTSARKHVTFRRGVCSRSQSRAGNTSSLCIRMPLRICSLGKIMWKYNQWVCEENRLTRTRHCHANSRLSTLMQLLFSFDQTLACQLSCNSCSRLTRTWVDETLMQNSRLSTLMQLLFSFDLDTRVVETLMQTHACQLSCNSCSRLTRTWELMKLSCKLSLVSSYRCYFFVQGVWLRLGAWVFVVTSDCRVPSSEMDTKWFDEWFPRWTTNVALTEWGDNYWYIGRRLRSLSP